MGDAAEADIAAIRRRFSEIYDSNEWAYSSGVGSMPVNAADYAAFLTNFMHRNAVESVVDLGCGDWQFSRFIDWSKVRYYGTDVVESVVARNRQLFAQSNIVFEPFRSVEELPPADLLVCKDVLQHLPNPLVQHYLDVFKTKYRYLLITNDDAPEAYLNQDIPAGGWRTLRFDRPPFAERAAIVLQWTVHWGPGWTRKATYLFYGSGPR